MPDLRTVNTFVVVAAKQERDAVRAYLTSHKYKLFRDRLIANRYADVFLIERDNAAPVGVGLMLAGAKGKAEMHTLVDALDRYAGAEIVIMVGMMAGIKGKAKLLDVVCPRSIFDVTAQGTRFKTIIGEPEPGSFDPRLHDWVKSFYDTELISMGIKLITHKKTVTVASKIDDVEHELAASALSVDPENVIGLEMEGSAANREGV